MLSMESVIWNTPGMAQQFERGIVYLPNGRFIPYAGYWMPARPAWPGFAVNSIFYAAILGILYLAILQLIGKRRIAKNCCRKCGYPIGVSPMCTECGTKLPTSPEEHAAK